MTKRWYAQYDKEVKTSIDFEKFPNLPAYFESSFDKYKDRPAFNNMGHTISFQETRELSNQLANYLTNNLKLKKGDRIAIMMPNCLQNVICLFAALKVGLIVVNVNPIYTPRELEHQLKDSGATTIIIFENAMLTLEKCIKNTPIKNVICTKLGDSLPFPKSAIINFVIKHIKKMVPKWNIPNTIWFNDTLKNQPTTFEMPEISKDCIAFLQYTGGTTGLAKGAILTHENVLSNLLQCSAWFDFALSDDGDVIINALPICHIFSLVAVCFSGFVNGCENVLITNPKDLKTFIGVLRKFQFASFAGVNTLFKKLMEHPDFVKVDFSKLRMCASGGMATEEAVARRWKEITGNTLLEGYGLTECSPVVLFNPILTETFSGKTGLPLPETDVQIRDENGKEVPVGEVGEICVSGPQVMKGYWNHEEETKQVFYEDGYLKTGDMAYMDERGYFKIVDRKKDMIIVSGFNVYPTEVENVIANNDKVFEVAAIGVPDETTGEAVKIFVVKHDDSLTKEELLEYCRENLTNYKVPKIIEFRTEELPKTPVGKILRRELQG